MIERAVPFVLVIMCASCRYVGVEDVWCSSSCQCPFGSGCDTYANRCSYAAPACDLDASLVDAGELRPDAGPRDGGLERDAGPIDAGEHDAGERVDAGERDAGERPDAGERDAGEHDAGPVDAGPPYIATLAAAEQLIGSSCTSSCVASAVPTCVLAAGEFQAQLQCIAGTCEWVQWVNEGEACTAEGQCGNLGSEDVCVLSWGYCGHVLTFSDPLCITDADCPSGTTCQGVGAVSFSGCTSSCCANETCSYSGPGCGPNTSFGFCM